MINEELTFKKFGYYSSSLSYGSAKKIIAECDECYKIREITYQRYRSLCSSCGKKNNRNGFYGKKHSEETKKKMSDFQKNKIVSEKTKNKMSKARQGFKWSEEIKVKIKESNKKYCKEHPERNKNNRKGKYKNGKSCFENYCIDCNKKISYGSIRCRACSNKNPEKIKKSNKFGKEASNYKHGKSLIQNYCIDCGKRLSKDANWYNSIRCIKCSALNKWKDEKYKEKALKAIFEGFNLKPNKPEQVLINLLNEMFPREYKYVGDGSFWIEGFNPDFINLKEKKIIEHFGTYWHNKDDIKKRDKWRLATYYKNDYQTLIIWENELKDLNKLKKRISKFSIYKNELVLSK